MRFSRRQRRTAQCPPRLGFGVAALASLVPTLSQAIDFKQAPSANLDFSNLGRIGVAGDFSGISLYEYEGQTGRPPSRDGSESLLSVLPNGAFTSLVSTDATIRAMCTFKLSDGELQGVVIAGNFTSLDGTESKAIALYDPDSGEVTPLDGLEGEVNALYCDNDDDTVYVGGNFRGANSTNAIAWYGTEGWTNLPFAGFNGPVSAITKTPNGHIIFGGTFTGLGNASAPSEPDGQSINIGTANITAENTASGNPNSIVCSAGGDGGPWLIEDDTPGSWEAQFGFGFEPTKLRLRNANNNGRGTRTFRYIAFPSDGIMNLTYIDPETNQNRSCSSECPLSDNSDVQFQDFHFVNKVGMDGFRIAISDWYGAGAGLAGIELFQENIFSYAVSQFNEPACRSIDFPSEATATGPWSESPSLESSSQYLTTQLTSDTGRNSRSVVFTPNIRESGNYSVNMYTPGCEPDDTCEQRGRVNVTGTMSTGQNGADFQQTLYQTNNFDKYDQIYFGYIDKTSEDFKPSVTLTPIIDDDIEDQVVVAQRVGFSLINSTGGLNGLFDFDPSKAVINTSDFEDSEINQLGASFDPDSGVRTLVSSGNVTFIGGNFTSNEHEHIVAINDDDDVKPLDGGLNDEVFDMHLEDNKLYVAGDFTNTQSNELDGLNHVAVYDTEADTWSALGAGVNGRVQYVVPIQISINDNDPETVIAFTGSFTSCNGFDGSDAIPVNGLAIWVPSEENWLQNLDGATPSYSGQLTVALADPPGDDPIYAGSISSAQIGAYGAVTLNDAGLGHFPMTIEAQNSSSQRQRRDVLSGDISGVVTGLFNDDDDRNLTVLAGRFTTQNSDDSPINNLIIIDGGDDDSITGLGDDISSDSTFLALEVSGDILYAGGIVSGDVDGTEVGGIVAYDLKSKSLGDQPGAISGGNSTVAVISARPGKKSEVYVGGSFTTAGAVDCPGICLYDVESSQWIRPGGDVGGDIRCLMWSDKKTLVVGGGLQNGGEDISLAIYKPEDEEWQDYPGAEDIPGPVDVITPASGDSKEIWVAGTSADDDEFFLMKYDGKNWNTAEHSLGSDTVVRSLQVFSVTEEHEETELLDEKQVLLLTGSIELEDFGMAAAVIYNGTDFLPYALTTSSSSNSGSIARIFSQKDNFFSSGSDNLALVFVVLIGLAISLALIVLLVVAGIILDRLRKRREGYTPAPTSMYDRGSGMKRIPPQELLESLGKGRPGAPHV